jgi:hypothetical protein
MIFRTVLSQRCPLLCKNLRICDLRTSRPSTLKKSLPAHLWILDRICVWDYALFRIRKWGKLCYLACWSLLWPLHMVSCNNWDSISVCVLIPASAIVNSVPIGLKKAPSSASWILRYITVFILHCCYSMCSTMRKVILIWLFRPLFYIWPLEMVYYSVIFLLWLSLWPLNDMLIYWLPLTYFLLWPLEIVCYFVSSLLSLWPLEMVCYLVSSLLYIRSNHFVSLKC